MDAVLTVNLSRVKFIQFPGYYISVGLIWNLKIEVFFKAINHAKLFSVNFSVFPYKNKSRVVALFYKNALVYIKPAV